LTIPAETPSPNEPAIQPTIPKTPKPPILPVEQDSEFPMLDHELWNGEVQANYPSKTHI